MVVWSYHIVTLKLLHCNSTAVFFLYFYLSKLEMYKPIWWWLLKFCPNMSIKFTMVVWRYHTVTLKLLHCNSTAVFFLYFYLSKQEIHKPIRWWLLKFCPNMSIKLKMVVWSYHIITLKLLHCNSTAVFFLYFYLSKQKMYEPIRWWLLTFWIIINIWIIWKTNIVFCVCEKLHVENHGGCRYKNFAK